MELKRQNDSFFIILFTSSIGGFSRVLMSGQGVGILEISDINLGFLIYFTFQTWWLGELEKKDLNMVNVLTFHTSLNLFIIYLIYIQTFR
jgi:hypothetical protein